MSEAKKFMKFIFPSEINISSHIFNGNSPCEFLKLGIKTTVTHSNIMGYIKNYGACNKFKVVELNSRYLTAIFTFSSDNSKVAGLPEDKFNSGKLDHYLFVRRKVVNNDDNRFDTGPYDFMPEPSYQEAVTFLKTFFLVNLSKFYHDNFKKDDYHLSVFKVRMKHANKSECKNIHELIQSKYFKSFPPATIPGNYPSRTYNIFVNSIKFLELEGELSNRTYRINRKRGLIYICGECRKEICICMDFCQYSSREDKHTSLSQDVSYYEDVSSLEDFCLSQDYFSPDASLLQEDVALNRDACRDVFHLDNLCYRDISCDISSESQQGPASTLEDIPIPPRIEIVDPPVSSCHLVNRYFSTFKYCSLCDEPKKIIKKIIYPFHSTIPYLVKEDKEYILKVMEKNKIEYFMEKIKISEGLEIHLIMEKSNLKNGEHSPNKNTKITKLYKFFGSGLCKVICGNVYAYIAVINDSNLYFSPRHITFNYSILNKILILSDFLSCIKTNFLPLTIRKMTTIGDLDNILNMSILHICKKKLLLHNIEESDSSIGVKHIHSKLIKLSGNKSYLSNETPNLKGMDVFKRCSEHFFDRSIFNLPEDFYTLNYFPIEDVVFEKDFNKSSFSRSSTKNIILPSGDIVLPSGDVIYNKDLSNDVIDPSYINNPLGNAIIPPDAIFNGDIIIPSSQDDELKEHPYEQKVIIFPLGDSENYHMSEGVKVLTSVDIFEDITLGPDI